MLATQIAVFVALAVVVGAPLVAFSVNRIRRAGEMVRGSLHQAGYEVEEMQYRFLRWGPYAWTTNLGSQIVYQVVVRKPAGRLRQRWPLGVVGGSGWRTSWNPGGTTAPAADRTPDESRARADQHGEFTVRGVTVTSTG